MIIMNIIKRLINIINIK